VLLLARNALGRRTSRQRHFGAELSQDGVWNMLLELLIAKCEGRPVSIKCLWLASGAPQSTALRWVNLLVGCGHVERTCDPSDGRRQFIEINDPLALRVVEFLRMSEG
jgi:DNA repair protein RadC